MAVESSLHDLLAYRLSRIEEGQASLEECLAEEPEHADQLRPLLEIALEIRHIPRLPSRPDAYAAGMERMLAVAEAERRKVRRPGPARAIPGVLARRAPAPRLAVVVSAGMMLLAAGVLLLLSWLGTPVVQTAVLTHVDGAAEVLAAGEEAWRPIAPGEQVRQGDRVRTGAGSIARLAFFDGSAVVLGTDTEIALVELRSLRVGGGTRIRLEQRVGRTISQVQPLSGSASRFEIETPVAVTAVRGTMFSMTVEDDGTTHVAVDQGAVDVTARRVTIRLVVGEGVTVRPGRPPERSQPEPTSSPTPTSQPEPIEVVTEDAVTEPAPTAWPTATPSPLPTVTPWPTLTAVPTSIPTSTPLPGPTSTPSPVPPTSPPPPPPTATPVPPTPTPIPTPTDTPWPLPPPPNP
jgi:hypothetical protein